MTETSPGRARRASKPSPFARTAAFSFRRRKLVVLLWIALLAAVWGVASATGDDYRADYSLPGTDSQRAADLLAAHGSDQGADTLDIVLYDEAGLRAGGTEGRVTAMLDEVGRLPDITEVVSPYAAGAALSGDGTTGYATVVLAVPSERMTAPAVQEILDTARDAQTDGLRVELGGDAARLLAESGGAGEGLGILAALVVLVLLFGSVVAAGLPIITALLAVGSTLGVIVIASHAFTIADYTPYMMMLVGLGVGIDYALLIFARFRTELAGGETPERAAVNALDAAGRTVFFAGCTVIVALLGLVALGLGSLQGIGLSVALTVLVTMAAALTLLPALLGFTGARLARRFAARDTKRAARGARPSGDRWRTVAGAVQRRPLLALLLAVAALLGLSAPALGMRLGFADAGNDPETTTSRAAYDLLSDGFGPGFNGPFVVVTAGGHDGAERAAADASALLADTPGIAATTPPVPSPDGAVATVVAFPDSAPQDAATADLFDDLRDDVLPGLAERTGAEHVVGGATAANEDFAATTAGRMPLFVGLVVGVSLLILLVVFRSFLIPLKAALLNLLSIGAAVGAMTAVFQNGLFGVEPGPVESFLPVMIFAVVFGLSMDYEIFLVSRIHEEWRTHGDHRRAVREGLAHTGSVVTAAGAIMIVVFGAFLLSSDRMLQQMGFGMAVAIFVDAVIIRCLMVPAAMQLMGRRAWWLPASLARSLPKVELERH
ncbi:MMPL family transporter [Streptomyces avicenniae]|uniref:MMPL family transporter n=1 Tax=Streptomyces avicenniae TaxID=500153 RepID=UPI000DA5F578|nr:MMPL family transporter [Streptomyces avicenniae]